MRQLDRVSRELMTRAWAAGGGPGDDPLPIDLDSTVCETYGLAKKGAQGHDYAGVRGYHPLLSITAGSGHRDGGLSRTLPARRLANGYRPGR